MKEREFTETLKEYISNLFAMANHHTENANEYKASGDVYSMHYYNGRSRQCRESAEYLEKLARDYEENKSTPRYYLLRDGDCPEVVNHIAVVPSGIPFYTVQEIVKEMETKYYYNGNGFTEAGIPWWDATINKLNKLDVEIIEVENESVYY